MKFALLSLLTVIQCVNAMKVAAAAAAGGSQKLLNIESINFESGMTTSTRSGRALLSHSRRLEGDGEGEGGEGGEGEGEGEGGEGDGEGGEGGEEDNNNNNNNNNNRDDSWMQKFDIKFIGCHHVAHWNSNAEDAEDVKIQVERHVRYRLCPSNTCSDKKALGCSSGYGDYIVDMDTFLQMYLQNKQDLLEQKCESALNNCGCGGGDDDDADKCEYKCYVNAGLDKCIENNPYYDDANDEDEFDLADYTYCTQYDGENGGGDEGEGEGGERKRNRLLRQLDQYEVEYFLGPYCSDKGDEIRLGMFTDDTCTEAADAVGGSTTFYETFGSSIPYYGENLVDNSCYSCLNYDYENYEADTREICTETYAVAGKCETKLSNTLYYPNENTCTYMSGIKLLKHSANGIVYRPYRGTRWAAITIAFFATSFVLLAFYCCYLTNKVKAAMDADSQTSSPRAKKGFVKTLMRKLSFNRGSKKRKDDALL